MEVEAENLSVLVRVNAAGTVKCAFYLLLVLVILNHVKSTATSVLLSPLACEFPECSLRRLC